MAWMPTPRVSAEASHLASTLNLVAVGLGISLLPACLRGMRIDGVTYRRLTGRGTDHLFLWTSYRAVATSLA
jgi:hypothetical protein